MALTPRTPLGPSVLNKRWYLDVDTSTSGTDPDWTPVNGLTEFQYNVETESQDDSDFDSDGWGGETNTAAAWSISAKCRRAPQKGTPTAYDEGQEFLRLKNDILGPDAIARIRWYEVNGASGPQVEAYEGLVSVGWTLDGGDNKGLDRGSLTLKGQGKPSKIAHPGAGA